MEFAGNIVTESRGCPTAGEEKRRAVNEQGTMKCGALFLKIGEQKKT